MNYQTQKLLVALGLAMLGSLAQASSSHPLPTAENGGISSSHNANRHNCVHNHDAQALGVFEAEQKWAHDQRLRQLEGPQKENSVTVKVVKDSWYKSLSQATAAVIFLPVAQAICKGGIDVAVGIWGWLRPPNLTPEEKRWAEIEEIDKKYYENQERLLKKIQMIDNEIAMNHRISPGATRGEDLLRKHQRLIQDEMARMATERDARIRKLDIKVVAPPAPIKPATQPAQQDQKPGTLKELVQKGDAKSVVTTPAAEASTEAENPNSLKNFFTLGLIQKAGAKSAGTPAVVTPAGTENPNSLRNFFTLW